MVQRRIQVQGMRAGAPMYKNMVHGLIVVWRNEGAGALYAGKKLLRRHSLLERYTDVENSEVGLLSVTLELPARITQAC